MQAGHLVTIHTRTKERARPLLERGAAWAETPREAADGQDVVVSMVGLPCDVEEVHLGKHGTLRASTPAPLLIDMTSSLPSLARSIQDAANECAVATLDAPVTGGDIGARNATLSILVGGRTATFEQALPLFRLLGKTIVHHGGAGSGQQAKLVNQIMIASTMVGLCEALIFARASGLDGSKLLESLSAGAASSWSLTNLAPRIFNREFDPGFFIDHFVKDLAMAVEEGRACGLELPGLRQAERLYSLAKSGQLGDRGTHGLYLLYERGGVVGGSPSA